VLQPTSTVSSAEAERKRALLLEATAAEAVVARSAPTVRWLLCGRGRPVSTSGADADYTVVVTAEAAFVLFPDIEGSRVAAEERFEELGFEPVPFAWHKGPQRELRVLLDGAKPIEGHALEGVAAPLRRHLGEEEVHRYRAAGADAAEAMVEVIDALAPGATEAETAADIARRLIQRDFHPPVLLVAGEERQRMHRHPLPTRVALGRHALLAFTAERDGLHVSMTRIASFGRPPAELSALVAAVAEVDAAMLAASRPGTSTGAILDVAAEAYAAHGFPEEWRRHHQGGITGYAGREVFAIPGEVTELTERCAVAWNPSITGGAKSEDTALVTADGVEVITRTPDLPELDIAGLVRPAIAEV
jgi:Xaa-Pro aminopeptidase